jgi:hypothetical protein
MRKILRGMVAVTQRYPADGSPNMICLKTFT